MISLTQHISEKLVINKDYKNENYFDVPDLEGYCLRVTYPIDIGVLTCKRIGLHIIKYHTEFNKIIDEHNYLYEKSSEGIYYHVYNRYPKILWLLFFKDTAKEILNIAIKNNNSKFDIRKYVPSLHNKIGDLSCVYRFGESDSPHSLNRILYTKYELREMKDKIK